MAVVYNAFYLYREGLVSFATRDITDPSRSHAQFDTINPTNIIPSDTFLRRR